MYFVGIDLAWSPKNFSGVCISKGKKTARVTDTVILRTDVEIVEYVGSQVSDSSCVIAIDAPLIVPNHKGRRVADELITKFFRKYEAGAHPTNRERLKKFGGLRGENLVSLFQQKGFLHNPYFEPRTEIRTVIEVFPHPAQVVIFNLNKSLKYKFKKGRNKETIFYEFGRYVRLLKSLENRVPSLFVPTELLNRNIALMKRTELKSYEDILDAIFCSYIAQYYWYWGKEQCHVFGDLNHGYIVSPVFPGMKRFLEQRQTKLFNQ